MAVNPVLMSLRTKVEKEDAYYAANVLDPDGYNVEICYKPWLYE
jgi:hypothetical protein